MYTHFAHTPLKDNTWHSMDPDDSIVITQNTHWIRSSGSRDNFGHKLYTMTSLYYIICHPLHTTLRFWEHSHLTDHFIIYIIYYVGVCNVLWYMFYQNSGTLGIISTEISTLATHDFIILPWKLSIREAFKNYKIGTKIFKLSAKWAIFPPSIKVTAIPEEAMLANNLST